MAPPRFREAGFDAEIARAVSRAQDDREDVDYDARLVTAQEAADVLRAAEVFVREVADLG